MMDPGTGSDRTYLFGTSKPVLPETAVEAEDDEDDFWNLSLTGARSPISETGCPMKPGGCAEG